MMKKIIIIVVFVLLASGVFGFIAYNNSDSVQFKKQLDLGQKYLTELDYEQAVVAFVQAIELEPRSVEAYMGLADAYIGMGDTDAALEALKAGYEMTGSEEIQARIQEIEAAKKAEEIVQEEVVQEEPVSTIVEFPFTLEDFTFAGYTVHEENYDGIVAALGVELEWYEDSSDWWGSFDAPEGRVYAQKNPNFLDEATTRCVAGIEGPEMVRDSYERVYYLSYVSDVPGEHERWINCSMANPPDIIKSPIAVGISREELETLLCIEEIKSKGRASDNGYFFESSLGNGYMFIQESFSGVDDVMYYFDQYWLNFSESDIALIIDVSKDDGIVWEWCISRQN